MTAAPHPQNESERLAALTALHLLDTPIEERFESIVRMTQERFDVSIGAFNLVDEKRQWTKAIAGGRLPDIPRPESFCAHTILGDDVFAVSDTRDDPRFAQNPLTTSGKVRFYAGCPVRSPDGHPVGSLCIADPAPRIMTMEERRALRAFADLLEDALKAMPKTMAHALAAELGAPARRSLLDPLTGTWNGDGLTELLRREWREAERGAQSLTLCLIEIDGDAPALDRLPAAARRLLETLRAEHSVGRDGNDRLMVIMPGCSLESAAENGERLRQALAGMSATASFGLTSCRPSTAQGIENLLRRAEGAIAIARKLGGNRIVITAEAAQAVRWNSSLQ